MSAQVYRGGLEEDWLDRIRNVVTHPYVVGALLVLCGMAAGVLVSSPRVAAGSRAPQAAIADTLSRQPPVASIEQPGTPSEGPTIALTPIEEKKSAKHRTHRHRRHKAVNPAAAPVVEKQSEKAPESEHWDSPDLPPSDSENPRGWE